MKVYFAATYSMRDQIREYAKDLRAAGIEVTSRWLDEDENPNIQISDLSEEKHLFYGTRDIEDVFAADVMVPVNDPEKHFRQGRTAEFGMASMINFIATRVSPVHHRLMPILVLGEEHENIFHYQSNIHHFPTWEALRKVLIGLQETEYYR